MHTDKSFVECKGYELHAIFDHYYAHELDAGVVEHCFVYLENYTVDANLHIPCIPIPNEKGLSSYRYGYGSLGEIVNLGKFSKSKAK